MKVYKQKLLESQNYSRYNSYFCLISVGPYKCKGGIFLGEIIIIHNHNHNTQLNTGEGATTSGSEVIESYTGKNLYPRNVSVNWISLQSSYLGLGYADHRNTFLL